MTKQLLSEQSQNYNRRILDTIVKISKKPKKLVYITFNKTANVVIQMLKSKNIETKKFFFIDSVTLNSSSKKSKKELPNVSSIGPLESIDSTTFLLDKIKNLVLKEGVDTIILDSVSSMFIYLDEDYILAWLEDLISFSDENNVNLFLFVLEDDANKKTIKQLEMRLNKSNTIDGFFVFGSSTSPLVIASVLSFIFTLASAIILFSTATKPKIIFDSVTKQEIVPLSTSLIVIALVSFILVYVLAIKSKKTEK